MRTSTNNPLFSSNCTTWLIHVHPTWSEENILAVLHIIPLDLQFRHIQRHVREHVNIFQCPLHVMDACQNCVTMDAMAGNQGTNRNALISLSTTVLDESARSVLNANSTMVSSLKSWLCYFRSFSKVATKLSCLSLLPDKVYWTSNIILNFEDDLGSKIQFKNMIKKTSFKLRPSNQHLELVNPRVADLTDVCHGAWTSLHDIDHDIWPWW